MMRLSEETFCAAFPSLFPEPPECGFDLPHGWTGLVWDLCTLLNGEGYGVACEQVKEKFGGLRFYVDRHDDSAVAAIRLAEMLSFRICQDCSKPGKRRGGPWIRTLCDECASQKKATTRRR
jgi:hypothetical protein